MRPGMATGRAAVSLPGPLILCYYLYLGLLPLASFAALTLDPGTREFVFSPAFIPDFDARAAFHVYSAVGIFLTGIFGLIIVQFTPLPANRWLALLAMVDAPVQVAAAMLGGSGIDWPMLVILDFTVELAGITGAGILVSVLRRPDDDTRALWVLATVFGTITLGGVYGRLSLRRVMDMPLHGMLLVAMAVTGSLLIYWRTYAAGAAGKGDDARTAAARLSSMAMVALWGFMAYFYGRMVLFD